MAISDKAATAALVQISEIQEERTNEPHQFMKNGQLLSSDDEKDAEHPIFDTFFSTGGFDGVLKVTDFLPNKFHHPFDERGNFALSMVNWSWNNSHFALYNFFL